MKIIDIITNEKMFIKRIDIDGCSTSVDIEYEIHGKKTNYKIYFKTIDLAEYKIGDILNFGKEEFQKLSHKVR
jgi:uncharacterized HAD superfamily protein